MIRSLSISGLALIDRIEVSFDDGLTVLSGETGAGKTMLVQALDLAFGQRADVGLVREGHEEARVAVTLETGDGPLLVERRVNREGPNRCLIDGRQTSAQALAAAAECLVDLHGQHDHQRLLHQRWHAEYLDAFVGDRAGDLRDEYVRALEEARRLARTLRDISAAEVDRERLEASLREEIAEIEGAAVSVEEDAWLRARLPMLRHARQLAEAVGAARDALQAPPEAGAPAAGGGAAAGVAEGSAFAGVSAAGALDRLREAARALALVRGLDETVEGLAERLEVSIVELDDLAFGLADYLDGIDTDPAAHTAAEERAALLSRLKERYGGTIEAVLEHLEEAKRTLAAIEGGEERRAAVEAELAQGLSELARIGGELSAVRREAGQRFASEVQEAVRELAMPDARFVVEIMPVEPPGGPDDLEALPTVGLDVVEFLFSANAGEAVRPLARVASGGELSRLMLAVKGVLGRADVVPTLVFDEIDAGLGGETALAVAAALKRLAAQHQVLVVTHLPQIAAVADHNLVVEKHIEAGRTVTTLRKAQGAELEVELARMLSGDVTSEASRMHARQLLGPRATK